MLKAFQKLKGKKEGRKYPGGICKGGHHTQEFSTILKEKDHCDLCKRAWDLFRIRYFALPVTQRPYAFVRVSKLVSNDQERPFTGTQVLKMECICSTSEFSRPKNWGDPYEDYRTYNSHEGTEYVFVDDGQGPQRPHFSTGRTIDGYDREGYPEYYPRRMIVDSSQINFDLIRRWLRECESEHKETCSTRKWETGRRSTLPPVLRVIDVEHNCLILAPPKCRYVALSYVWGGAEPVRLYQKDAARFSRKDGLREVGKIHLTILNAINLTKEIGERYLWTDTICIFQDKEDQQAQISSMDSIYRNSLLTIVAASGKTANAGLPGVVRNTRKVKQLGQHIQHTVSGARLFSEIPPAASLKGSVWDSRGWCFQEKVLSKRYLVFIEEQIFWYCNQAYWTEDMNDKISRDNYEVLQGLRIEDDFDGLTAQGGKIRDGIETRRDGSTRVVRTGTFASYITALEDFKARNLTNQDDSIKAFEGILSVLSPLFRSEILCGLPESLLDCALLWQPANPMIPNPDRNNFPSWSWAGWEGPIRYERPYMIEGQSQRPVEQNESSEERIRPMNRWYKGDSETQQFNEINKSGCGLRSAVDTTGALPNTWTEYDKSGMTIENRTKPMEESLIRFTHLRFRTAHGHFLLQPPLHGVSLIQGVDSMAVQRFAVGYIVLNDGSIHTDPRNYNMQGTEVELIVLSEAQFFGERVAFDGAPVTRIGPEQTSTYPEEFLREWDLELGFRHGEYELYNVMLIEQKGSIWYRRGLGRISKKGWNQTRTTERIITLG